VAKSGAGFANRVKAARPKPRSTRHLDEMFVTVRGEPYLLWRAVDDFVLKRNLLRALLYRKQLAARFVAWREFTELAENPSTAF
jgi:putative transposase